MTKLLKSEKDSIIDMIQTYRALHSKIAEVEKVIESVEKQMKILYSQKDSIIAQMQVNRDQEGLLLNELVEKYGKGKLSIDDMTWITEDQNENVAESN